MSLVPRLASVRAVVFDTDGVLVDSAGLHAAAWKKAFDACLAEAAQPPFDADEEYRRHVDGKSRWDGAAAFLAARDLDLPAGAPGDPPGTDTVWAVAARKEQLFNERLRTGDAVPALPDAVGLLKVLHAAGMPRAAVSASRHATELLERAGIRRLLDTVVDGNTSARLRLPGKPDPALFLEAARRLRTPADRCAVVEDALAGVEAGRRGGFGLVIGVDRGTRTQDGVSAFLAHGADIVVNDLQELLSDG